MAEVMALMRLLQSYVIRERDELIRQGVEVKVYGDLDRVPRAPRRAIEQIQDATAGGKALRLNLMISYGSRAEIARALVVKPDILYMDEPFTALDALMSLRIRNELLRILATDRHTVMLITHDVEEAIHLADRIMVLTPRPARIQATFDVRLPHPRRLTGPEAQEIRAAVLRELGVEE